MKKNFLILFMLSSFIFSFSVAWAVQPSTQDNTGSTPSTQDNTSACANGACTLKNPLGELITTPQALIGKIINSVMGIVGSIALLMFVYGGFTWMTSRGNKESITKGRDILVWSSVGLAVIFMSYAFTAFVLNTIGK